MEEEDEEEGVPEEGEGKDVKGGKANGKVGGTKNKNKGNGKAKGKDKGKETTKAKAKAPPLVSVAAIVGGMSAQKQKRVLERGVDVLVATPGRLWDVVEEVSFRGFSFSLLIGICWMFFWFFFSRFYFGGRRAGSVRMRGLLGV